MEIFKGGNTDWIEDGMYFGTFLVTKNSSRLFSNEGSIEHNDILKSHSLNISSDENNRFERLQLWFVNDGHCLLQYNH